MAEAALEDGVGDDVEGRVAALGTGLGTPMVCHTKPVLGGGPLACGW